VVALDEFTGFKAGSPSCSPRTGMSGLKPAGGYTSGCSGPTGLPARSRDGSGVHLIESVTYAVPKALSEVITLSGTLKQRAADADVLPATARAPQRRHHSGRWPARAPPRRCARFRDLTNYIACSLLQTGGFRLRLHPES